MNELVFKGDNNQALTTSLLVAEKFGKNHSHVLRDIENLSCSKEFRASNFGLSSYTSQQNKELPMYIMTKDGFTFLVMGYTGETAGKFKEDFISAFNQMEKTILTGGFQVPTSFREALLLAAQQQEKIEVQQKTISKLEPKASFADQVFRTDSKLDIGLAAKTLQLPYGRNTLFKKLRQSGVFFSGRNEPKQKYVDAGYFEIAEDFIERKNHPGFCVMKVIVTQKGLAYINVLFGGDRNKSKISKIG
jgi:Rha family phage regulatory protein